MPPKTQHIRESVYLLNNKYKSNLSVRGEGKFTVSVIITAYNRTKYLLEALNSLQKQTIKTFEIVLVTNFSLDLQKFSDLNIKHILLDGSIGQFLFEGVRNSEGEIIVFMDDDDVFLPEKIESILQLFHENKTVYVHNNSSLINDAGRYIRRLKLKTIDFNLSSISVLRKIINLDILMSINSHTDKAMYLFALNNGGRIISTKKKLTKYRIHHNNTGEISFRNSEQLCLQMKQIIYFQNQFKECKKCLDLLRNDIVDATLLCSLSDPSSYNISRLFKLSTLALLHLNFRAIQLMCSEIFFIFIRHS